MVATDPGLSLVYDPVQIGVQTEKYLDSLADMKRLTGFAGVPICIPTVDDWLDPGLFGTIRVVQGRPGCGKTSFQYSRATTWANVIKKSGRRSCVVYATAETMAENLNVFHASHHTGIPIRKILRAETTEEERTTVKDFNMVARSTVPLFVIGMSIDRDSDNMGMNPDSIGASVMNIEQQYDLKPELVVVDYLQILDPHNDVSIRNQDTKQIVVGENMKRLKSWARRTKSFWEVAVQAKREVDQTDPPFPAQGDGQWASGIEQDADSGLSITRAAKYQHKSRFMDKLQSLGINTDDKEVMTTLAVLTIWKQRHADVKNLLFKLDPRFNIIDEWDLQRSVEIQ